MLSDWELQRLREIDKELFALESEVKYLDDLKYYIPEKETYYIELYERALKLHGISIIFKEKLESLRKKHYANEGCEGCIACKITARPIINGREIPGKIKEYTCKCEQYCNKCDKVLNPHGLIIP